MIGSAKCSVGPTIGPPQGLGIWVGRSELRTCDAWDGIALLNGQLYALGGYVGESSACTVAEVLDMRKRQWQALQAVPQALDRSTSLHACLYTCLSTCLHTCRRTLSVRMSVRMSVHTGA